MTQYRDGEPCGHPGCLHHRSHPCESCGRIGGVNKTTRETVEDTPHVCPDCNGTGETWKMVCYGNSPIEKVSTCELCNGEGEI